MSIIGALHAAARAYAAAGIPVFPIIPGDKIPPSGTNSFYSATTDRDQVDRWWSDNPNYNIAIRLDAMPWGVIDIEPGGFEQWDALVKEYGAVPHTYSVVTPRGGRHLYYEGVLPTSVKKIAKGIHEHVGGIDTRGTGGYVLVPPSVVKGKTYAPEDPAAPMPDWINVAPMPAWLPKHPALLKPENVAKAAAFGAPVPAIHLDGLLRLINPACDRDTWRDVVAALANVDCPDNDTRRLAHWWSEGFYHGGVTPYNYDGPDAVDQVYDTMPPKADGVGYGTILHHARQGGYEGPSAVDLRGPAAEVFAHALSSSQDEPPQPVPTNPFRLMRVEELQKLPPPEWRIDGIIPGGQVTVIVAETGHYKTFLALDMCMSVSMGIPFADKQTKQGKTVYAAGEGRISMAHQRAPAWWMVKGVERTPEFTITPLPRIADLTQGKQFIEAIREDLAPGQNVGMIVIDTYARSIVGMVENDSDTSGAFGGFAERLIHEFPGAAVVVLAHFGKNKSLGARGSNALRANMDTYIEMESNTEKKIVDFHIGQHRDAEDGQHLFFKGSPVLDSLYFSPITEQDARKALASDDELSGPKVGGALRSLQAVGISKAVTTIVLAQHLCPQQPEQSHEDWQKQVTRVSRELGKLSRTRLAGYCEKDGNVLLWFLPG